MTIDLDPMRDTRGVTIDQYRASMGEYLGATADDAFAGSPISQLSRLARASGAQLEAEDRGDRLLTPEEANDQGRELGLHFDQPIAQGAYDVVAQERQRQIAAEATYKRARLENGYGTLRWLLSGGTDFLVQAVDPINIAASFIPAVGEARYAMMAARLGEPLAALARGAIEGAAGQALLEPIAAIARRQMGEEYRLLDTVLDLTFGSGLGVILHGVHYGAGAGFHFLHDRYILGEPRPAPLPAGALPSAAGERIAPTDRSRLVEPAVETRDSPPPRQPVSEQMERLRPETKEAALRAAVAQLAQDKPVDVEPILAADPAWPEVKASIEEMQAHLELQRQAEAAAAPAAWTIPADYVPTGQDLAVARRVVRGWTPEKALPEPLSLSEFVRRAGGLKEGTPEAGDLLAADLGERRKGLVVPKERGRDVEHLAQAAYEEGYPVPRNAIGSGVDVHGFIEALAADAVGDRRMMPDDSHTSAWTAQQQYFDELARSVRDLGLEPRGMDPRRLAYIMSRDPDHGRLLSLLDRIDRLGDAASLELVERLDREAAELERQILEEPGAWEEDMAVDHREFPAATLNELEAYYELERRAVGEDTGGRQPLERGAPGGGPPEGGEAPPARPSEGEPPAEEAGLRPEDRTERAAAAPQGTDADLGAFAERQAGADLQADTDELARSDERAAVEEPELDRMLREDLAQYGALLDDADRAEIADMERAAEEATRAVDALAACKLGGA
jgi:hypothetical protein